MFDKEFIRPILLRIDETIEKIITRTARIHTPDYFASTPEGMERLDSIAMRFFAIGESLNTVDRITAGTLLAKHPEIDWSAVKGFHDHLARQCFDIDAEQVFRVCKQDLEPLSIAIKQMIGEMTE